MSVYHAFSGIDDAVERTKNLLFPFNWSIWWRIAVISLLTGGLGGINFPFTSFPGSVPDDMNGIDPGTIQGVLGLSDILILLIVVILLIAIIFTFISSVFQFIFVECLSKKEFGLKKYFVENLGNGLMLFGFMVVCSLVIIAAAALFILSVFSASGDFNPASFFSILLLFLLLIFIFSLILLLTIDFVVPVMLKDNCGIMKGWKKCGGILRASLSQTVFYLIARIILSFVVAIIMIVATIIVLLVVGVPFFLLFVYLVSTGFSIIAIALLAVAMVLAILLVLIIGVPFYTFLRLYSLSVLERMSPEYKIIEWTG